MNPNSPCSSAALLPRGIVLLLGMATLLLVCSVAVPLFPSADLWWHLRSGQYIIETHGVPRTDPFSFSAAGTRWIAHEWLSEVVLYAFYRCGKFIGLGAALAISVGAAFWLATWRPKHGILLRAGAAAIAAWSVRSVLSVRPGDFTLLLVAVYIWLLRRHQETGSTKPLAFLPLLMLLWVNLHGGYVLGLVVILLFTVGTVLNVFGGQRECHEGYRQARRFGLALLSCVLVVPLNPNGLRMYSYPLETLHSSLKASAILEWQPLDLGMPAFRLFEGIAVATLLLLAVDRKRTRATELMLFIPFALLALRAMRNISPCALVCAGLLGNHLPIGSWSWLKRLQLRGSLCAALAVAAVVGTLCISVWQVKAAAWRLEWFERARYPKGAVEFLQKQGLRGPIFNSYQYGGYLIWRLYPASRVYVDGRADLYGYEFLAHYSYMYWGIEPLQPELDRLGVNILVLDRFSYLAMLSPQIKTHWKKAYEDTITDVFVRSEGASSGSPQ